MTKTFIYAFIHSFGDYEESINEQKKTKEENRRRR